VPEAVLRIADPGTRFVDLKRCPAGGEPDAAWANIVLKSGAPVDTYSPMAS
jgi:hypothetical protein